MIKSAEVRFYQSHKSTKIKPAPGGLTVITGTSHHGKSALIRAIKWPLLNRPIGFDFKSWFSEDKDVTRSAIEFDDGYVVREKSKNTNLYKLSNMDEPLTSLKTDLPEEVTRITRMSHINIQSQHDPYFMLQNSPGEVGRMFNEAVELQIIDESLKGLNKKASDTLIQLRFRQKENEELEKELKTYDYLNEIEPLLSVAEDMAGTLSKLEWRRKELTRIYKEYEDLELKMERHNQILQHEAELVQAFDLHDTIVEKYNRLHTLLKIANDLWDSKQKLEEIGKVMVYKDDLDWCVSLLDGMQEKAVLAIKLKGIVDSIEELEEERKARKIGMAGTSKRYFNQLRDLKVCPMCGTDITDEVCEHLEEIGL